MYSSHFRDFSGALYSAYRRFDASGIATPSITKSFESYPSLGEFQENLVAPVKTPIFAAAALLHSTINLAAEAIFFAIDLATLNFSDAANHFMNATNAVTYSLAMTFAALLNTLSTAFQLLTRTFATGFDAVASLGCNKTDDEHHHLSTPN